MYGISKNPEDLDTTVKYLEKRREQGLEWGKEES